MRRKHRKTGNRRGRPYKVAPDLGKQILDTLAKRLDPKTGLTKPDWMGLARELGVGRTTIARTMRSLRESGNIESVVVEIRPNFNVCRYRLPGLNRQEPNAQNETGNPL